MNNFYNGMNEAMNSLNASVEDTKQYQTQMASLSKTLHLLTECMETSLLHIM